MYQTHTCMRVCTHNNMDSHAHTLTCIHAQHNYTDTWAGTHIHSDANTHGHKGMHK